MTQEDSGHPLWVVTKSPGKGDSAGAGGTWQVLPKNVKGLGTVIEAEFRR